MKDFLQQLQKDLKEAGYKTVEICSDKENAKHDLFLVPASLLTDKNFAALPVLKKAGIKYGHCNVFTDVLIFRDLSFPESHKPESDQQKETKKK